jgi:hypothetical protein
VEKNQMAPQRRSLPESESESESDESDGEREVFNHEIKSLAGADLILDKAVVGAEGRAPWRGDGKVIDALCADNHKRRYPVLSFAFLGPSKWIGVDRVALAHGVAVQAWKSAGIPIPSATPYSMVEQTGKVWCFANVLPFAFDAYMGHDLFLCQWQDGGRSDLTFCRLGNNVRFCVPKRLFPDPSKPVIEGFFVAPGSGDNFGRSVFLNDKQRRAFGKTYPTSRIQPTRCTLDLFLQTAKGHAKDVRTVSGRDGDDYGSKGVPYEILQDNCGNGNDMHLEFIWTALGAEGPILIDSF